MGGDKKGKNKVDLARSLRTMADVNFLGGNDKTIGSGVWVRNGNDNRIGS